MSKIQDRGRLDWVVEVAGASAPALAAAFAAAKFAPVYGWAVPIAALVAGGGALAVAWVALRIVPPEPRRHRLPAFGGVVLDDELLLDQPVADILLLDQPLVEREAQPLVERETRAVAELLLDDPLATPAADSRVVQLFADGRMPNAGQLKTRIDQHLADSGKAVPAADASDALSDALAELRRSLRQA